MPKGFRKCIKIIEDHELFNDLVDYARAHSIILNKRWEERTKKESCRFYSFFHQTQKYAILTTRYFAGGKGTVVSFKFDLYDDDKKSDVQGATVYATLQKYYKTVDFTKDEYVRNRLCYSEAEGKFLVSVAGVLGFNRKHNRTRQKAWCYDRISAYAWHLMQDLPLGDTYETEREVREGEIGFFLFGDSVKLAKPGQYASFIFKLQPSPFKPFVEKYFKEKSEATTQLDKQRAKDMLNFGIGYFQRKNPFIRYYIVLKANELIDSLIDDDTLMWNTDAIYSRRKRDDLDIGDNIGQFRLEYEGDFAYIGNQYQKGTEPPHARRVIRKLFKPGFDLLKDPMPKGDEIQIYKVKWNHKIEKVN